MNKRHLQKRYLDKQERHLALEAFFATNLVQQRVPNAKFYATVGFGWSGWCLRKAREYASHGHT
jgi:hypothetical protein